MPKDKKIFTNRYGDEAPKLKQFLLVIFIVVVLIAFAWITYNKLGWLH
jgi:hypothetical protein